MFTLLHRTAPCHPAFAAFAPHLEAAIANRPDSARATALTLTLTPRAIRVDVREDAAAYRVSATLAGVAKDDISVSVEGNEITIAAEFKPDADAGEGERLLHSERAFGRATRTFRVAEEIAGDAIEAKYADGVLSLKLPKKAPVSAKKITIS